MRATRSPAACWTLLFLLAIVTEGVVCKGGRGGARGSARGTSRRSRPAPRYSSSGTALRVAAAAAAAAGGAAVGAAAAGASVAGPESPPLGERQPSNTTAGSGSSSRPRGPWALLSASACLWCAALAL